MFWCVLWSCDEAKDGVNDPQLGYAEGEGARYWRLICWLMGVTEEIKSPYFCRGFGWLAYPVLHGVPLTCRVIFYSAGCIVCRRCTPSH